MGFTPQQINQMTPWQFEACLHGFLAANTPKSANKLTENEAEELFAWLDKDDKAPRVLKTQTYWWEDEYPTPAGVVTFRA
jgi:hypothetical protein